MEKLFEKGDVVQLKSGGPKMTIDDYDTSFYSGEFTGFVNCKWFDNDGKFQKQQFDQKSLKKINEGE